MHLLRVVEALVVVGVLLWLVNRFIPMQSSINDIERRSSDRRNSVAA
jgi:hypothetical protein